MREHLRPIEVEDMPEYPQELCDPSGATDYFTKFWHDRWLSSRLHLTASLEVQAAALNLFFYARKQNPIGSLPVDQRMLARLLRISDGQWHELMNQEITPLHGWREYSHDGGVVLGHPVVIEVAQDALDRREARKLANDDKAVQERRRRLVGTLRQCGCSEPMTKDWALVCWLDDWLAANHHGQRRFPQIQHSVERALRAAAAEGRLNKGR
ncbi:MULTISPECIES: hypothetical protein [unclassified Mameliella]|uniref:hypothetical protein n=1 Tax=unclassified Mameliella TaxID=2630630 RepID=UPI00274027C4|nr:MULTISPECIES: hypothetical protein [unclassified Mameliella]